MIVLGQHDGELPPAYWTRKTAARRERDHGVGETFNHCPVPSFQRFPSLQHILSSLAFGHYSARMPSDPPKEYISEYGFCLLCVGGIWSHDVLLYVFCIQNTRLKDIALFWNVSLCCLVERCPGFVGICCLQTKAHEEANRFLWNDGNPALTSGSPLRRQHSESSYPEELRSEVTRRFPTVSLVHSIYIYT